ncbi:hypothetical protein GQ43DRAFT_161837 [Delitschia confertaspora ATCC 74209]|uniref:Uncharacterized protein n=1 Tax=Delitschia confertaspora ATCC 74209 TaxID=1513339 RepID=A0A9P4JW26_9PLEO|nr:hypothetical protein GQ43DRAFT_161837 [Delitschia confertaspora ATCC 74209]
MQGERDTASPNKSSAKTGPWIRRLTFAHINALPLRTSPLFHLPTSTHLCLNRTDSDLLGSLHLFSPSTAFVSALKIFIMVIEGTPRGIVGLKLEDEPRSPPGLPFMPRRNVNKKEDHASDVDFAETNYRGSPMRGRGNGSPTKKALRAREKALAEKFEVVQSRIGNQLEGSDGVVVDVYYNAPSKDDPMNSQYDYTHFSSCVPISLSVSSSSPSRGGI